MPLIFLIDGQTSTITLHLAIKLENQSNLSRFREEINTFAIYASTPPGEQSLNYTEQYFGKKKAVS